MQFEQVPDFHTLAGRILVDWHWKLSYLEFRTVLALSYQGYVGNTGLGAADIADFAIIVGSKPEYVPRVLKALDKLGVVRRFAKDGEQVYSLNPNWEPV